MSKLVIPGVIAQSGNGGGSGSITPISPLQYQTTSEVVTTTVPYNIYSYENVENFFDNPELQPTPYTSDTITMTEDDLDYGLLFQFNRGYQPQLTNDFRITGKFFVLNNPSMEIFLNETLQKLDYEPRYYWNENNLIDFYRYDEGDPITVHFYPKNFTGSTTTVDEELDIPCSEITGNHLLYEIYYDHINDKVTFTFKQSDETLIGSAFIENFSTKVEFSNKTTVSFWTNDIDYPEPINGIYKFETIEVREVTTKNLELNYDDNTLTVTDGELTVIGGGGGTVDQTYDPTSTNAQSGTAVAEAVAPALKNTATGTNSLTILSNEISTNSNSINIGSNAKVGNYNYATAVGNEAWCTGTVTTAIGSQATAGASYAIAIGGFTFANGTDSIAIGTGTGMGCFANRSQSIQLGTGTNSTAKTLQVWSYPLLDGNTGKIPNDRLPYANSSKVGGIRISIDANNVVTIYTGD